MSGGDGVHNEGCPGNGVTSGEDPWHICAECFGIDLHPPSPQACCLFQAIRVRSLPDGENHQVGGDDLFGTGKLVKVRPAIDEAAEINVHCAHAGHPSLLAGDLLEGAGGKNLDAFFLGVAHLPVVSGHLASPLQAGHADPTRAQADSGHRRVDGNIATAEDQNAPPLDF